MSEGRGFDSDADEEDVSTQALDVEDVPTQALEVAEPPGVDGTGGGLAPALDLDAPTELIAAPAPSPLDDIFAADRFREFDDAPLLLPRRVEELEAGGASVGVAAAAVGETSDDDEAGPAIATRGARRREDARRRPGILGWLAVGLGAVLALIALFLLGTRIPQWIDPEPLAVETPTSTPTPTPTLVARPDGPVAPGTYAWNELGGGECLADYVDPWQPEFTVVDCAGPHPAQLTYRGTVAADATAAYPGEEALAAQLPIACGSPTALNLAAAGAYVDVQVQASYPVSAEAWDAGERDYYCFVTRASGEPLTGSLAPTG